MFYIQIQAKNEWVDISSCSNPTIANKIFEQYSPAQLITRTKTEVGVFESVLKSSCESCR